MAITARGIARSGSRASSPSTAAASKPMNAVKPSTTPRKSAEADGARAGSNGAAVSPSSPPWTTIAIASRSTASTPVTVTASCRRVETRMSSSASSAASASSGKNHVYQLQSSAVCSVIAADRKKLEITSTNEIPTAKPPP